MYFAVCVTVTFVGLLVISSLVLIFVCCLKHCTEKNHRHSTVMLDPGLFAATSVSCDVELRGDLQKKLKMTKYDPFEFPREKLLLSDVLLGNVVVSTRLLTIYRLLVSHLLYSIIRKEGIRINIHVKTQSLRVYFFTQFSDSQ